MKTLNPLDFTEVAFVFTFSILMNDYL